MHSDRCVDTMLMYKKQLRGPPPLPRWGHSTVAWGQKLVIFGGELDVVVLSSDLMYDFCVGHVGTSGLNDLHILNLSKFTLSTDPIFTFLWQ